MSDDQIDLLDWLVEQPPEASEVVLSAGAEAIGDPDLATVLLTRADPACNMHRFYSLELATSLFGEWGVVRHWGRVGTSGRSRTYWFTAPQEAEAAFQSLLRAKRARRYVPLKSS